MTTVFRRLDVITGDQSLHSYSEHAYTDFIIFCEENNISYRSNKHSISTIDTSPITESQMIQAILTFDSILINDKSYQYDITYRRKFLEKELKKIQNPFRRTIDYELWMIYNYPLALMLCFIVSITISVMLSSSLPFILAIVLFLLKSYNNGKDAYKTISNEIEKLK